MLRVDLAQWWPVALMAALMLGDLVIVAAQGWLCRAIERARAALRENIAAHDAQHGQRMAELQRAIARSEDARRRCNEARAAMEAADRQLSATKARRFGQQPAGQVVSLPVMTLASVAREAAQAKD
jgi:hypothetical protein